MNNPFLSLFSIDELDVLDKMTRSLKEHGVEAFQILPSFNKVIMIGQVNESAFNIEGNTFQEASQKYCELYEKTKIEPTSAAA